jgi:ribonuclease HI
MKKCYVVYIGKVPGVYDEWEDCQKQVNRFPGNSYKGYMSREVVEAKWRNHMMKKNHMREKDGFPGNSYKGYIVIIPVLLIVILVLLYLMLA